MRKSQVVVAHAYRWLALTLTVAMGALLLTSGCSRSEGCSVEEIDERTVRIVCDDGTEALIELPGLDELPEPCDAVQNTDGTVTILCPGSDEVTLAAGERGTRGPTGPPGPGCTVERGDDGLVRVTCGEDTVELDTAEGAACEIEREEGNVTLVCGDDSEELARCGNGFRELGQECDFGEQNAEGCVPEPGALRCTACTSACELQEIVLESVTLRGLVLHVNEGNLGAVPDARVFTSHGFTAQADAFGRYEMELPAGEEFVLQVGPQDVSRSENRGKLSFANFRVPLATAPYWQSLRAPEEADAELHWDIRLLSGWIPFHELDETFLFAPAQVRGVTFGEGQSSVQSVRSQSWLEMSLSALRDAQGQVVPPASVVQLGVMPVGQPDHDEDVADQDESLNWAGTQQTALPESGAPDGLPGGLAEQDVLAGAWIGGWDETGPLRIAPGALEGPVGSSGIFNRPVRARLASPVGVWDAELEEDVTLWHFNEDLGEWEQRGELESASIFAGQSDVIVDAWTVAIDRFGWWVVTRAESPGPGCVTGTLTLDGEPLQAGVGAWSVTGAASTSSDAEGAFCMPAAQGDVSILSTALPADWDRWAGHAQVSVEAEGSCGEPAGCVDVGEIALEPLAAGCMAVDVGDEEEVLFGLPLSVRMPLEMHPEYELQEHFLAEDQWLLAHAEAVDFQRLCVPVPTRELAPIVANDLDPWCPAASPVFPQQGGEFSATCSGVCDDTSEPPDAEVSLFCGGE